MRIIMPRLTYTKHSTQGTIIIDNKIFCYTLEDVVRPPNTFKVPNETAIPAGLYEIILNYSERFKRIMPLLLNVPNFIGIRMHGGNTSADTEGCILVAHYIVSAEVIQGTAEKDITKLLQSKPNEKHFIEIINTFPYKGI